MRTNKEWFNYTSCRNHLTKILWMKIWYIHYYRTRMLSQLGKPLSRFPNLDRQGGTKGSGSGNWDKWGPLVPVGNTNRDQRICQSRRGRHSLWSRLVLRTGTKGHYFFSCFFFSVSFELFPIHFRLGFVLKFKRSMNCSNINIYSFTHIKCNTKVNYIQSGTQKSITYKVQQKFYLILSYLLLLSMFDTTS